MTKNIASHWFRASEATGDFMGIRYGRVPQGSDTADWHFVSHCECDGIGGFARLLRERGAELRELPKTKTPCQSVIRPLWRLWRKSREATECANRRDWGQSDSQGTTHSDAASDAVAWHLFSEEQTQHIRERCRRDKVTVNSFLLKHLDQAVRPEVARPHLKTPWMIPVNLRGDVNYEDDTENHVSCIDISIAPDDSTEAIHQQILQCLEHGEHRANDFILKLGRFLSQTAKMKYICKGRNKADGNIGAFSNLGVWDPEKKIKTDDSWLFCPPVVSGQLLGAGCVTFQNRLGLVIQGHPNFSFPSDTATGWMTRWVKGIGI